VLPALAAQVCRIRIPGKPFALADTPGPPVNQGGHVTMPAFARILTTASMLLLGLVTTTQAQDKAARHYAVISLLGDQLTIASYVPETNSRIEKIGREVVALSDPVFDHTVLLAMQEALPKIDPQAKTSLLAPSDRSLYTHQADLIDGNRFVAPAWLTRSLEQTGASHLLLVTKHRAPTRVKLADGVVGRGQVEGLGFYIDPGLYLKSSTTHGAGLGMLASYAYFKVSVIDLKTLAVVDQRPLTATYAVGTWSSESSSNPWDALTSKQKVSYLQELIKSTINAELPGLLKAG
jgi:hypothetical protein